MNHYTPFRQHIYLQNKLCPYVVPCHATARIDVSRLNRLRKKVRKTAFFVQAFSRALEKHPRVNSTFIRRRLGLGPKIIQFKTVDVALSVDRQFGNERFPFLYVIRDSNKKTLKEISEALEYAVHAPVEQVPEFKGFLTLMKLPQKARELILNQVVCSEKMLKEKIGTFNMSIMNKWDLDSAYSYCPRTLVVLSKIKGDELPVTYSFNHVLTDGAQIGDFHADASRIIQNCDFE